MSIGHFTDAGGYLDYGDAAVLLPVDTLQARVYTHRDAERALDDTPAAAVFAVSPTSMASSYALTQHPLAVVDIASLPDDIRAHLDDAVDADLAQFELIQVGRGTTPAQNRSLAEF